MQAQKQPEILFNKSVKAENYVPDFSYAGYQNGVLPIPFDGKIFDATTFGVVANDGLDDTQAIRKALEALKQEEGKVVLQLPAGRLIVNDILYIERSNFVLRGAGTGVHGTELYFPRPLMYCEDPESLQELREYLLEFNKRQVEKRNNIDLPFSQYAWSGGFIWTRVPGQRVKKYLDKYDKPFEVLAKVASAKRGEFTLEISDAENLHVGAILELQLFNKSGEKGALIQDLYKNTDVKVGSHHWNFPDLPLVKQQVQITSIKKNKVTIRSPLIVDVKPEYQAQLVKWNHLEEVGIEHFKISFPKSPRIAHHVEPGYNGIYLTRVFNSWVNNVEIDNADSGVLTEEVSNVTIKDITTTGENLAHYTVAMSGTYNVLAQGVKVYNKAVHPLSFNTLCVKSVFKDCEVFVDPVLDQHSGANHQNLFDNIKVHLSPNSKKEYPLFKGGGAGYWKPSHGAYNTFWNIDVHLLNGFEDDTFVNLKGMKDGPFARLIGVHGNGKLKVNYGPKAYIEGVNTEFKAYPSLYEYQLKQRDKSK